MRTAAPARRIRIVERAQGTCPIALAVFLIVYVGALGVVFAPEGLFVSQAPAQTVEK